MEWEASPTRETIVNEARGLVRLTDRRKTEIAKLLDKSASDIDEHVWDQFQFALAYYYFYRERMPDSRISAREIDDVQLIEKAVRALRSHLRQISTDFALHLETYSEIQRRKQPLLDSLFANTFELSEQIDEYTQYHKSHLKNGRPPDALLDSLLQYLADIYEEVTQVRVKGPYTRETKTGPAQGEPKGSFFQFCDYAIRMVAHIPESKLVTATKKAVRNRLKQPKK